VIAAAVVDCDGGAILELCGLDRRSAVLREISDALAQPCRRADARPRAEVSKSALPVNERRRQAVKLRIGGARLKEISRITELSPTTIIARESEHRLAPDKGGAGGGR
jgi:hypothetical protein